MASTLLAPEAELEAEPEADTDAEEVSTAATLDELGEGSKERVLVKKPVDLHLFFLGRLLP